MIPDHVRGICDRCGFEFRLNQLRKEWNGLKTCNGPNTNQCWEPRHPQDFVRARNADRAPYDKRVVGEITYLNPGDVTEDDL